MRTVEQIIADLKHQIYWSQPNIRFNELNALVNELENTLFPSEVVVEETVVEEVVEEIVTEELTIEEETVTEEPVAKTTKKTKK
jgi:hypothetical protein